MSVWESSVAREANVFQSVFWNSCCSEESAPSSQTLTVLTVSHIWWWGCIWVAGTGIGDQIVQCIGGDLLYRHQKCLCRHDHKCCLLLYISVKSITLQSIHFFWVIWHRSSLILFGRNHSLARKLHLPCLRLRSLHWQQALPVRLVDFPSPATWVTPEVIDGRLLLYCCMKLNIQ